MSIRQRAGQLPVLAQRAVHLNIRPRPANLSESREIYHIFQRFGEIQMYRHLRHEYHNPMDNSVHIIYRDAQSAQKALKASPVNFALERTRPLEADEQTDQETGTRLGPSQESGQDELEELRRASKETSPLQKLDQDGMEELHRPSKLLVPNISSNPTPLPDHSTAATPQVSIPYAPSTASTSKISKWFQVTVNTSHSLHQDHIERQTYWKHFTPMKSMAQEDLATKVPHQGLSDVSKRPPHSSRTPNRVMIQMDQYVKERMPSVLQIWQEANAEQR